MMCNIFSYTFFCKLFDIYFIYDLCVLVGSFIYKVKELKEKIEADRGQDFPAFALKLIYAG